MGPGCGRIGNGTLFPESLLTDINQDPGYCAAASDYYNEIFAYLQVSDSWFWGCAYNQVLMVVAREQWGW